MKIKRIPDFENLHQPFNNLDFEITNLQSEMIASIVSAHLGFRLDYDEISVREFRQHNGGLSIKIKTLSPDFQGRELKFFLHVDSASLNGFESYSGDFNYQIRGFFWRTVLTFAPYIVTIMEYL